MKNIIYILRIAFFISCNSDIKNNTPKVESSDNIIGINKSVPDLNGLLGMTNYFHTIIKNYENDYMILGKEKIKLIKHQPLTLINQTFYEHSEKTSLPKKGNKKIRVDNIN